jgi:long-chain acyl-CoA synthetase
MDILLLQAEPPKAAPTATLHGKAAFRASMPSVESNLGSGFFRIAHARGDYPAVVTEAGTYSYEWLLHAANSVRRYLCARPRHVGARVALQLSNSPEYLAAFYGALLAECVVVPLPISIEKPHSQKIYELCQPDVLISRGEEFNSSESHAIATLRLGEKTEEEISLPPLRRQNHDLAMLLFTSGSTGMPKGVMLSHRNLLANACSILHELPICADDRTLVVLPFCHAFGNSILQTHILSGATLLLHRSATFPVSIMEALSCLRATSFSAVPEVYRMLLKFGQLEKWSLRDLRYMTVAGGELRYELAAEIERRIAPASFYIMYGQSEATARLACLPPQQMHVRRGSIGKAITGVELAVMDDLNHRLPPGAIGMLSARGENVMLGYWQDPSATADVLSAEGWLRTGDIAHQDRDGYFYLNGRANLLVKVQGYRVHPAEIESVVETAFPHVRAVAIPTSRGEETRFVLFVSSQNTEPVDVEKIRATCQSQLAPHKRPTHVELLDRVPLTLGYKVDRAELARVAENILRADTSSVAALSARTAAKPISANNQIE